MNPFKYGKEVTGYQFYDRTEQCDELYRILRDGSTNVVLRAPRRYGKTSMVLKVLRRFKAEGANCLLFDMSRVTSIERFCMEYTAAVYAIWGGLPEIVNRMREYLAHLHPVIAFGDGALPNVTLDYGERMNSIGLSEVLDLPEKLAHDAGDRPVVIAFDEFQDVAELSKTVPLESVFRSVIQSHQNCRYVFFGSKTHLMKRMFGTKSRPFYKSALGMKIGKPPIAESEEFVVSRFANEGISVSRQVLDRLLSVSENIPYYVQAMGSLSYMSLECRNSKELENADLDYAVARFLESNEDYYEELLRGLSSAQREVVEALAGEPATVFDEAYRNRHSLTNPSTMHSALRELVRRGTVECEGGRYFVSDPFFALYVRTLTPVVVP